MKETSTATSLSYHTPYDDTTMMRRSQSHWRLLILWIIQNGAVTLGLPLVRAHLAAHSPYWPLLEQQLQDSPAASVVQNDDSNVEHSRGFIDFTVDFDHSNESTRSDNYPYLWLHALAAERVSLVWEMPLGDSWLREEKQQHQQNEKESSIAPLSANPAVVVKDLEDMILFWQLLQQPHPEPSSLAYPIHVALVMPKKGNRFRRPKRQKSTKNIPDEQEAFSSRNIAHSSLLRETAHEYIGRSTILQLVEEQPHNQIRRTPTISLRLLSETHQPQSTVASWELATLTRVHPLPHKESTFLPLSSKRRNQKKQQQATPSHKRLESFVVAHAANIMPGDVVVDPACQRGTFLVEAAKYWPLAKAFWGYDTNMGHLEHACMNADSTRTRLVLQHGSPWMLDNDGGDHLTERWIHKLVTSCLASNQQYEQSIPSLLKLWTECLCLERGRMVLLVKHAALKCIEDALTDTPWSISYEHCLSGTTILVVIEPITRQVSGTTRIEVKPKEEWVNWRLQTLPWMVPTDRPRWSNQILMARGKVRKRILPGR